MTVIKNRRGTASQWTAANPVLAEGEIGFETDTGKHKIGNGVSAWLGIHYFVDESGLSASYGLVCKVTDPKYGAKGDATAVAHNNGTDDYAAIAAAITDCHAQGGGTVLFPKVPFGYRSTAAISSPYTDVTLDMRSPIIYDGTGPETALTIGNPTAKAAASFLHHTILVERAVQSTWASDADVGVALYNHYRSIIHVGSNGFTKPLRCVAAGTGFFYNHIFLTRVANGRIQVELDAVTVTGSQGACNENNFYGGNFTCNTGVGAGIARYGIHITSSDGTYLSNNNNRFHAPSFELNGGGTVEAIPMLVTYGQSNTVYDARSETHSSNPVAIRTLNTSQDNAIGFGYNADSPVTIDDQGTTPSSRILRQGDHRSIEGDLRKIASFTNLHRKACYYDGATKVNVPGLSICTSATAPDDAVAQSGLVIAADYLELPTNRAVGVYIDTRVIKSFVVTQDSDAGYGGRMFVRCYDSSGTVFTSAGPNAPYVASTSNSGLTYSTARGGSYQTGVDAAASVVQRGRYFRVGPNVDHIFLSLGGATGAMRLRGFSVLTSESGECSTWAVSHTEDNRNYGTAAPTAGTWEAGRKVWSDTPTSFLGWTCTAAGTPGTWSQFGSVGSSPVPEAGVNSGLLGWAFDPAAGFSGGATLPTAGTLYGTRIWVPQDCSITNLILNVQNAGVTLTAGQCFAGFYSTAGAVLGVTADQAAAWATTGTKTMALAGGPIAVSAGFYDVAFFANGATMPKFLQAQQSSLGNLGASAANSRFWTADTGLTTTTPNPRATRVASIFTHFAAVS